MIGKEILNYRIISYIGQGGMGRVYLAEHKFISQQKVAIKVINNEMVNDYTRDKLKEEAEHLASLNHQNIVRFQDYHIDADGNIFLFMEYADGVNLEEYIHTISGLIVEDKICPLFEPILDAVDYAHKHRIIHRDIKPANIVITNEGVPKILDFGIATIMKPQGVAEKEDMIVGTPSYMSPEQVRGENIDGRSDVYSLGVLLHQMLTGNAPYDTTTLTEFDINKKVVEEPLPRMRTYYKYISEKVQKIVDKATAKNPEDRYQTCAEFKKALHHAIHPPKMPKWIWTSAAALLLILIGGGVYWWDYNRTKVYYYKDYVEQWGVPQGIGELSSNEMKSAHRLYRFEYKKRKLLRMSHVNSKESIIDDGESERYERPLDMYLYYAENGKISTAKVLDRSGKVLYVKSYNEKLNTVTFQYDDEYATEKTLGAQTIGYVRSFEDNQAEKGKISRWLLEYDENGYVSTIRYAGFQNVLVGDAHNIYGRKYVRDQKGRVLEEHYLSFDGKPKATKWGLGIKKFYYDEEDNWIKAEYQTVDGKPSYDAADGICVYVLEYDKHGNLIYAFYQDEKGELMLPVRMKVAGMAIEYDSQGFYSQIVYLGTDKKPCYDPTSGICKRVERYNDRGYGTGVTYYDVDGNKTCSSEGMASIEYKVDDKGNCLELWYYGLDDKLQECNEGNAGLKIKYDSIGNVIEYVMYGTDEKPCLRTDETAGYWAEYNDKGLVTKLVYMGTDLKPCKNSDGVITKKYDYDKRGNQIKVAYYDVKGEKLMAGNNNIAGWNSTYDDNGNEIERTYFDHKNMPCTNKNYAKWTGTFDDYGNLIKSRYYNLSGKLVMVDGDAGANYKRDTRGNILEYMMIGTDEKLAPGKVICRYKYDEFDNEIEFAVYDQEGKPTMNVHGYFKYSSIYNNRNQRIEIRYYDVNGELTFFKKDKYAIQKDEYNEKGKPVRTVYYGKKKELVASDEGWASSTREYDTFGNVIKQSFFGVDGKPTDPQVMVPEGFCKYDKWGNMIYLAAGDGKGNLIINPKTGWCIKRSKFDSRGNMLEDAYYDPKEKPLVGRTEGYHKAIMTYTTAGNEKDKAFYDVDNKPMVCTEGYHKEVYEYNNKQQTTKLFYLGTNGKPIDCKTGFHKVEVSYNEEGEQQTRTYYSATGALLLAQRWDGKEWVNTGASTRSDSKGTSNSNWQQFVQQLQSELPVDFGEDVNHLVATSFKVTGKNACELRFKTPKSKYEMTDNEVDNYSQSVRSAIIKLKTENLPSEVKLTGVLVDSKGRQLYSTTR